MWGPGLQYTDLGVGDRVQSGAPSSFVFLLDPSSQPPGPTLLSAQGERSLRPGDQAMTRLITHSPLYFQRAGVTPRNLENTNKMQQEKENQVTNKIPEPENICCVCSLLIYGAI